MKEHTKIFCKTSEVTARIRNWDEFHPEQGNRERNKTCNIKQHTHKLAHTKKLLHTLSASSFKHCIKYL